MNARHTFHPKHSVTTPELQPHDQQLVPRSQHRARPARSLRSTRSLHPSWPRHISNGRPIPPNTHSGLFLHVDPRQVTHTDLSPNAQQPPNPPPRILPHLRSRPTAYPSHSSSSRPKRQAAPSTFPARPPRACSTLPFPVKLTSPQGGSISERHPWGLLSPKLKSRLILPFHGHHRPRPAPIVRPRSRVPVPRPRHRGISIVQRPYHPQSHNPGAQLPKPVANPALSIPVVGGLGRLGFPTGTYGMMPAFSHECVHPSHRVPSPCVSTCVGATTSLPGQINSVPIRSAHTRPARSRRNLTIDRH